MPQQKYKIGMFFKCLYGGYGQVMIVDARLNNFMGEYYWTYTVKNTAQLGFKRSTNLTEYQLEGIYTIDTTAQVLYGT